MARAADVVRAIAGAWEKARVADGAWSVVVDVERDTV